MKVLIVETSPERDTDEYCRKYLKFVSERRREKAERMRSERDRRTSVAAELALRLQIKEILNISDDMIDFTTGEHGKPFLKNYEDFHFSISHSGNYAVCVCSSLPVGVDIENNDRGNEKIAKRYFTADEYRCIYETGETDFAKVWTSKEAYVKYTGNGLSEGLDTFSVLDGSTGCRFVTTELPSGYTVTVCTASDESIIFEVVSSEMIFGKYEKNSQ